MALEVLHHQSAYGWEFRCPMLVGVSGGARSFDASCAAAEHALRVHLSRRSATPLSPADLVPLVRHMRDHGAAIKDTGGRPEGVSAEPYSVDWQT